MPPKNNHKVIVAYVPVLHEGYRQFFDKHKEVRRLFLLGRDITNGYRQLEKDIRALDPELIRKSILGWGRFETITIVSKSDLADLDGRELVMPDDEINHELQTKYFPKAKVLFDKIFLRWDKFLAQEGKPVEADQRISKDEADIEMIRLVNEEAKKSSDWWRTIGAAIVRDGKVVLITHNKHMSHEYTPYVNGDPRAEFKKGINIELSTGAHAEAALVAEAAKKGIKLEGTELYVSTFPCPPCAKLIAISGIKKLYYSGWYGVLDAEPVLKAAGVEIIFVDTGK